MTSVKYLAAWRFCKTSVHMLMKALQTMMVPFVLSSCVNFFCHVRHKRAGYFMISRREALQLIKDISKRRHAAMVSAMMKALAKRLGRDEGLWEIVGLLHDLDYDETKHDASKHGLVSAKRLKGRLPEYCLYAIKVHDHRTGLKPRASLDNALIATDTLALFLERAERSVDELEAESLMAEIDSAAESQPWFKRNLLRCKALKIGLNEFLELCINAIKNGSQSIANKD